MVISIWASLATTTTPGIGLWWMRLNEERRRTRNGVGITTRWLEQLRLLIENVKERQESELINNSEYDLVASEPPSKRIKIRNGPPSPDDLDANS
jgi:hypothetical protein